MMTTTTADEERDAALDDIDSATKHLSLIIIDRCWGYEEFAEEYLAKLRELYVGLVYLRGRF